MGVTFRTAPALALFALALPAPALSGPPPGLVQAHVESQAAPADLQAFARRWAAEGSEPAWLAWEVPAAGGRHLCCSDGTIGARGAPAGGVCRIERHGSYNLRDSDEFAPGLDDENLVVLLRKEGGRLVRLRAVSRGCGLDAGGRSLLWLDEADPAASLRLLSSLVGAGEGEDGKDRLSDGALMALAHHAGPAADDALERFLDLARPVAVRKQAAFWMGNARGRRGYEALGRLVRADPSPKVRAHAVFALGLSPVPEAVEAMIRAAREDASAHVRGQALFWLAQKAGARATAAITGALEDDPETEVKKKAVFALSQLPKDEGVPRLIEVARAHRNPEVRKQAMFWLGQSGDPRALAFFEDVLGR